MKAIATEQLLAQLNWRYAVKKFDQAKKIPHETWAALEQSLILTPSSYGLQPWKFLIVTDPKIKKILRGHSWNQSQVEDCSHFVVFLTRKFITENDVDKYIARISELRNVPLEALAGFKKTLVGDAVTGARSQWVAEWCARQAYIALGSFITSAALLGVDTCPMEGFSPEKYNEALGLADSPFHTIVACAVGYRSAEDPFARMKKVRFPVDELITRL